MLPELHQAFKRRGPAWVRAQHSAKEGLLLAHQTRLGLVHAQDLPQGVKLSFVPTARGRKRIRAPKNADPRRECTHFTQVTDGDGAPWPGMMHFAHSDVEVRRERSTGEAPSHERARVAPSGNQEPRATAIRARTGKSCSRQMTFPYFARRQHHNIWV